MTAQIALLAGQRQSGESYKARIACNDFLRMGPGRSVAGLWRRYGETKENQAPTQSRATLEGWSANYNWTERAESYDAEQEAQKNARAQEIMASGLALAHERVEKLKRLADFVEQQLYEQGEGGVYHNVWVPDVKQIGSGPDAERVDLERFNASILSEFRATLDDLAAETGGRVKKQEHTGADGGPIVIEDTADALTDEQRVAGLVALYERVRTRIGDQADDGGASVGAEPRAAD